MSGPNGAEVIRFRRAMPPSGCPFCGGEGNPVTVTAPTGQQVFGVQCGKCGILGRPGVTQDEALRLWNERHGDPVTSSAPDLPLEVALAGQELVNAARAVYSGQAGRVEKFVLIMVQEGLQPRLGIHLHSIVAKEAHAVCQNVVAQLGKVAVSPTSPGGIILPGKV